MSQADELMKGFQVGYQNAPFAQLGSAIKDTLGRLRQREDSASQMVMQGQIGQMFQDPAKQDLTRAKTDYYKAQTGHVGTSKISDLDISKHAHKVTMDKVGKSDFGVDNKEYERIYISVYNDMARRQGLPELNVPEEEDEVVGSGRIGLGDVVKQVGGDIRSFFGR